MRDRPVKIEVDAGCILFSLLGDKLDVDNVINPRTCYYTLLDIYRSEVDVYSGNGNRERRYPAPLKDKTGES